MDKADELYKQAESLYKSFQTETFSKPIIEQIENEKKRIVKEMEKLLELKRKHADEDQPTPEC